MIGSVGVVMANAASRATGTPIPEWIAWCLLSVFVALFVLLVWVLIDYYRDPPLGVSKQWKGRIGTNPPPKGPRPKGPFVGPPPLRKS